MLVQFSHQYQWRRSVDNIAEPENQNAADTQNKTPQASRVVNRKKVARVGMRKEMVDYMSSNHILLVSDNKLTIRT